MSNTSTTQRMHPLVAGAAGSVMLVSLLGAAAITGILPSSHSSGTPASATPVVATPAAAAVAPVTTAPQPAQSAQSVAVARPAPRVVEKTIVHHRYVTHTKPVQMAQNTPAPAPVYAPAQPQQDVAQVSPIGIGVGAVVGGVLGSKVGGGNGKTLATIAGAVGGGYIGNEIAKRY